MARRELGPAALAVAQAVAAALTDADAHLLVACSGGPDSLALAFAAHRAATRDGRGLTAVVVDHGLQPESAAVADRARDQLGRLGFADVVVAAVTVDDHADGGPEAAARAARYAALQSEAAARQATIWLGHTLDDQAENVLLGLARGLRPPVPGRDGRPGRTAGPTPARPAPVGDRAGLRRARSRPVARPAQRRPPVRPRTRPPHGAAHPGGRARARASPRRWPGRPPWPATMPTCSTCWRPRPTRAPTPSTPRPCSTSRPRCAPG